MAHKLPCLPACLPACNILLKTAKAAQTAPWRNSSDAIGYLHTDSSRESIPVGRWFGGVPLAWAVLMFIGVCCGPTAAQGAASGAENNQIGTLPIINLPGNPIMSLPGVESVEVRLSGNKNSSNVNGFINKAKEAGIFTLSMAMEKIIETGANNRLDSLAKAYEDDAGKLVSAYGDTNKLLEKNLKIIDESIKKTQINLKNNKISYNERQALIRDLNSAKNTKQLIQKTIESQNKKIAQTLEKASTAKKYITSSKKAISGATLIETKVGSKHLSSLDIKVSGAASVVSAVFTGFSEFSLAGEMRELNKDYGLGLKYKAPEGLLQGASDLLHGVLFGVFIPESTKYDMHDLPPVHDSRKMVAWLRDMESYAAKSPDLINSYSDKAPPAGLLQYYQIKYSFLSGVNKETLKEADSTYLGKHSSVMDWEVKRGQYGAPGYGQAEVRRISPVSLNLDDKNIVVHTGNIDDLKKNKDEFVVLSPGKDESGEKMKSETYVTPPEIIKSNIESLAHDQLALEKTIKEKEQLLSQLPSSSPEEIARLIAQLEGLKNTRLYLDLAESAIKGRTGSTASVFSDMSPAEIIKLKIATKQMFGMTGTPTDADMIRLLSEFYAHNSNNRTELISVGVALVDKQAVTNTGQRQQTNMAAIDALLNSLRNGTTPIDPQLTKLRTQYESNRDTLAGLVTAYLDSQPDTQRQTTTTVNDSGADAAVQQLVTTQVVSGAANGRFESGYSGSVSMVISPGWTISNGVGNADENTYLNYDFRNGLNMPLLLSGGVTVLNPQIETGTANHFNSGRFSTLDDAHYGNFAHAAWGMWQGTGPSFVDPGNGFTHPVNRVYWTLGPQFHRNDLPASGDAFYNGPAIGDLHSGGQIMVGELVGDILIDVGLSDMAVGGMLSLYRQSTQAAWGSFSFNGPLEWPSDGENLGFGHGTATMSGTGVTSSEIYGNFQGPNGTVRTPPEVSGGWELQKSNGEFGAGVWRAKEAEPWTMTAAHMSDSGRNNFSGLKASTMARNGVNTILKLDDDGPSGMNTYVSPEFTTGAHNHGHANRFAELNDSTYGNFQYVQWGDWSGSGPILAQRSGHVSPISHIYWVGGTPSTPPRTGSATYSGPAIGDLRLNGTTHVRDLAGVITLGVNFATDSMTTNLLLNRVSTNTAWVGVSGTAQINRQGSSGFFDTNQPSFIGVPLFVGGEFHGPAAGGVPPEAAGSWNVDNGVNGTGIGIFRAKKQ